MIAAAIDIGTNSVLLTVGRQDAGGAATILDDASEITRLGQGVDRERTLQPAALARTVDAVARFAGRARELGAERIRAVGTSAARDARNAAEFAALLRDRAGVDLEILPGEEEARLSYKAVRGDASLGLPAGDLVVADIGGGSVEFIHGDEAGIRFRTSLNCGAVRVTERFFSSDPPSGEQIAQAAAWVDAQLAALPDLPAGAPLVGIGGTFVNLAAVRLGMANFQPEHLHGTPLDAAEVERQIALFVSMPTELRRGIPGLEPKRADVITAGALLVRRILARLSAGEIRASVRGLRYGVLFEMLGASP